MSTFIIIEIKDFYIRFPHYEKNALFMPVIRYILDGREVYQRMYMPLYDWQRLFEAEGVDLKAISEGKNQEYHFVKTVLISRDGRFFESFEDDNEDDDEALQMRLDGGGAVIPLPLPNLFKQEAINLSCTLPIRRAIDMAKKTLHSELDQ